MGFFFPSNSIGRIDQTVRRDLQDAEKNYMFYRNTLKSVVETQIGSRFCFYPQMNYEDQMTRGKIFVERWLVGLESCISLNRNGKKYSYTCNCITKIVWLIIYGIPLFAN